MPAIDRPLSLSVYTCRRLIDLSLIAGTLDRGSLPRCAVGDVLSIYMLIRSLESELGLGVFLLEEFFCALALPTESRLLSDVRVRCCLFCIYMPAIDRSLALIAALYINAGD